MKDENFEPEMPPIEDAAQHVLGYLYEIGPTMIVGMGDAPLTHSEIAAWQVNTGIELSSWEARTLLRLSREHMSQTARACKPNCPPPWASGSAEAKVVAATSLRAALSAMAKS